MKKKILYFSLFTIALLLGLIGTTAWSFNTINSELQTNTIEETKIKFGAFEQGQLIRKKELSGIKIGSIRLMGTFIKGIKAFKSVKIYSIAYKSDGLIVTGIMVTPEKPGKYPTIVYNRGGNQNFGRLDFGQVRSKMVPLASNGYVVIASNYRGNSGGEGKEEFGGSDVRDILNLVPALTQVKEADTSALGIFGVSRGGMMTYQALKASNLFKTAVVYSGTTNLFTSMIDRPKLGTILYPELIPNFKTQQEKELKERSVVYWPEKLKSTPLLILHSKADKRVGYQEAVQLVEKLDSLQSPYQMISFENDNHGIRNHQKYVKESIVAWFDQYLKSETTPVITEKNVTIP